MTLKDPSGGRRRRGDELEAALLEAAWDELAAHGYGSVTFDSVAKRAGTSRAVLYRRWPTKADLIKEALGFVGRRQHIIYRDTGSLRSDLIDVLTQVNSKREALSGVMVACMGDYFLETGSSPADLRAELISSEPLASTDVWDRALARGEVDPRRLTDRVRNLAFDLYRHDTLMSMRPLTPAAIEAIVDEVVLPIVTPHS